MLNRIKKIIQREKLQNSNLPGVILLFKRVIIVLNYKLRNLIIHIKKDGTFSSIDVMSMCSLFPKAVLDIVINDTKPRSVLDVGCGTGMSLGYFLENDIDAWGIENSAMAKTLSKNPDKILKFNLNNEVNLNKSFDLVWCFEVIEHIHPSYERNILNTLINHSNKIVLSAAKPGQQGHGHFNCQPQAYWVSKFNQKGYQYDYQVSQKLKQTNDSLSDNLMFFSKEI